VGERTCCIACHCANLSISAFNAWMSTHAHKCCVCACVRVCVCVRVWACTCVCRERERVSSAHIIYIYIHAPLHTRFDFHCERLDRVYRVIEERFVLGHCRDTRIASVSVCVCVRACVYVCVRVCVYVCVACVYVYVYVRACMHVCS